jgi:hypothetical protein
LSISSYMHCFWTYVISFFSHLLLCVECSPLPLSRKFLLFKRIISFMKPSLMSARFLSPCKYIIVFIILQCTCIFMCLTMRQWTVSLMSFCYWCLACCLVHCRCSNIFYWIESIKANEVLIELRKLFMG